MIAVLQRVNHAYVDVVFSEEKKRRASIKKGILCLLGIENGDTKQHIEKAIEKIFALRIFSDEEGKMNLSLEQVRGELLLVSQFTLAADCKKGRRPSFDRAMPPEAANELFAYAIDCAQNFAEKYGLPEVQTGLFQAEMMVGLENDGPVSFILQI